jgi:hypothetical protein
MGIMLARKILIDINRAVISLRLRLPSQYQIGKWVILKLGRLVGMKSFLGSILNL